MIRVLPAARLAWSGLLDLVYPPKCAVCGRMGPEPLCGACRAAFRPLARPFCARCAHSLPETSEVGHGLCPECAAGTSHYFTQVRAAGHYEGTVREAVLRLKYGGRRRLAASLGAFLADGLRAEPFLPEPPEVVVPVPLHPSRERERGFNQSALLAREVGRALGLPVSERALRRVRRTRPQASLRARERAANIQGAFAVREPEAVADRVVLLLDDVLTTCHTADECARVLLNAGARLALVAAVARDSL